MADRRDAGARTVPTIAAGVVAGVAAVVLLGWLLDSEPLKAVIAGRATMKPNTAIAFVLAAVSLWLQRGSPAHPLERRVALGCATDRKSTRLNSSHSQISYAVFCLKKKTTSRNYSAYVSATRSV